MYHRISSALPEHGKDPVFLQIYFTEDPEEECSYRHKNFTDLDWQTLFSLQELLHSKNHLIRSFKSAIEEAKNIDDVRLILRADKIPIGENAGRYNLPQNNDVGVLLVGENAQSRDIIIKKRSSEFIRINETHPSYDSLQYPLILWNGQDGYHLGYQSTTGVGRCKGRVSPREFYAYLMMMKKGKINYLLKYKRLTNQYWVDQYAKIEQQRLNYYRFNQTQIRAESYKVFQDAMMNDPQKDPKNIGQAYILPKEFVGGPRYMQGKHLDGMTYVYEYGSADLFLTMTTNPKWEEILEALDEGEEAHDRHDIVARVFHAKLKKLIVLLKDAEIFGKVKAMLYSVEWQKR